MKRRAHHVQRATSPTTGGSFTTCHICRCRSFFLKKCLSSLDLLGLLNEILCYCCSSLALASRAALSTRIHSRGTTKREKSEASQEYLMRKDASYCTGRLLEKQTPSSYLVYLHQFSVSVVAPPLLSNPCSFPRYSADETKARN